MKDNSKISITDVQNADTQEWVTIISLKVSKSKLDDNISKYGLDYVHSLLIDNISKEIKEKLK